MKCSKCDFENPEGAKFCNECGSKMETICHSCGLTGIEIPFPIWKGCATLGLNAARKEGQHV